MENLEMLEIKSDQVKLYKEFLLVGLVQDEENFRLTTSDDLTASFPINDGNDSFALGTAC